MTNARIRGKIRHEEWPKIAERFSKGETLTEIARSYRCTAPAIRYIVNRASTRVGRGKMERDKLEGVGVVAQLDESRRKLAPGNDERSYSKGRRRFSVDAPANDIWGRISNDIATFLTAVDSLSTNDSDNNYETLLLATDRLLLASARTRLELERVLTDRKKRAPIRSVLG